MEDPIRLTEVRICHSMLIANLYYEINWAYMHIYIGPVDWLLM